VKGFVLDELLVDLSVVFEQRWREPRIASVSCAVDGATPTVRIML
jgi:hypothetical protein